MWHFFNAYLKQRNRKNLYISKLKWMIYPQSNKSSVGAETEMDKHKTQFTRHEIHWIYSNRRALTTFSFPLFYRFAYSSLPKHNKIHSREKSLKEPQPTNSTTIHRVRAPRFVATAGMHTRWFFTASALKWRSKWQLSPPPHRVRSNSRSFDSY